jgi:glycosyltransferase involved in cell wall biosynthesis
MHICHLAITHQVLSDSRIMERMACTSANAGHSVSVITSGVHAAQTFGQVDLKTVSIVPRSRKWYLILWIRCLNIAIRERADIYHIHEIPLMLSGVILKLLGKKVVVDFHENFEAELFDKPYLNRFFMCFFYLIYQPFKWVIIPFFDHVVIAEDGYAQNFAHVRDKCTIVRNHPKVEQFRFLELPAGDTFKILYVGTITEDRGCKNVVEAVKKILLNNSIDISLTLIGRIHDRKLQEYVENEQVKSRGAIRWDGPRTFSEVQNLITEYSLGFSALHDEPNYRLSLPTKILEYNSAGLMCIASDLPITKKYVIQNFNGQIIRPNDTEALVASIIDIYENQRYLERTKIRRWVSREFSWKEQFLILENIYAGLGETYALDYKQ